MKIKEKQWNSYINPSVHLKKEASNDMLLNSKYLDKLVLHNECDLISSKICCFAFCVQCSKLT